MRQASHKLNRGQVAQTRSVSAPVAGWNARDPLAEMKEKDAVILDNFFCTPYDVRVRDGYSTWVTGLSGSVETLCSYSPTSGTIKLFAGSGGNIYDVSTKGAVGAAVQTGLTSNRWQHVNFGTPGGNFLYMVNGVDAPRYYDGSAWTNAAITGVTPANLIHIAAFKSRLWFCEKNTLKIWYLPVLSISGAATAIDFSSLFNRGGYLMAMGDWSLDAGYGMDDYAVFITSEGQVAIYKGTDPSSATTWSLIGIYDIGSPVGRRCMLKYAGDLLVICQDGLAPLSKSLMSSRVNSQEMLTDRIQHAMSDYVTSYGINFGWETTLFPKANMLFVNVPATSTTSYQLVMNTISGAWSRFIGWNAHTFELHGDLIYFGGSGTVYKAWDTSSDNGSNISFEGLQSFNYFGTSGQLKQVSMLRPIISYIGYPSIKLGVNADFDQTAPEGIISTTSETVAKWDSAVWDQSVWGDDNFIINRNWQTSFAIGYCIAGHMVGSVKNSQLRWASTDFVIKAGGVI